MQTISPAQQQRAMSATQSILAGEIPAVSTLPITRVKMNDAGMLQLRASDVTGPTGVRFARVEVHFNVDTLKYSVEAVLPDGSSVTILSARGQHAPSMHAVFDLVDRLVTGAKVAGGPVIKPNAMDALLDVQEYGTEYRRTGRLDERSVAPELTRRLASAEVELARHTRKVTAAARRMPSSEAVTQTQKRSELGAGDAFAHRYRGWVRALALEQNLRGQIREQNEDAERGLVAVAVSNHEQPAIDSAESLPALRRPSALARFEVWLTDSSMRAMDRFDAFARGMLDDRSDARRADARRPSPLGRFSTWVSGMVHRLRD